VGNLISEGSLKASNYGAFKARTACTVLKRSYIKMKNDFSFSPLHMIQGDKNVLYMVAYPAVIFLTKPIQFLMSLIFYSGVLSTRRVLSELVQHKSQSKKFWTC
jgi:hypothetical protein